MYKRILCATDFSETSIEAVQAANALAQALSAELLLVHVVEATAPLPGAFGLPSFDVGVYQKAWRDDAQRQLNKLAEQWIDAGVRCRTLVRSGRAAQTIDELASEEDADLIVVATHGMTGWRHYLMGSVAQKVIQYTQRPVLVIRGAPGARPAPGLA